MHEKQLNQVRFGIKEISCNGIYVRSKQNPCEWDFIPFEYSISSDDIENMPIEIKNINRDIYDDYKLNRLVLRLKL